MRTRLLFSTLLLAACDGPGGGSTTVSLDTIGPPDLVAFKLGTGDWQTLEPDGNLYSIEVDEPYIVAVACNDLDGLFDTYLVARTPEDDPEISAPCTGNGPVIDGSVQGTLVQAGDVSVEFARQSVSANGAFDVPTSAGAHELVAITATGIAIRDVDVSGVTRILVPIDVDAALVPSDFTITNAAPDESPFAFAQLFTEHRTIAVLGAAAPEELLLAPDSILGADDAQIVNISVSRGDLSRSVFIPETRDVSEHALALPEHLSGVTLDETGGTISATWGALPDHDTLSLTIDQDAGGPFLFHELLISRAYAEAMGESIALDLAIPGFDPAGAIDVTAEYNRSFNARTDLVGGVSASSQLFESVNQPTDQVRARVPASSRFAGRKPALR